MTQFSFYAQMDEEEIVSSSSFSEQLSLSIPGNYADPRNWLVFITWNVRTDSSAIGEWQVTFDQEDIISSPTEIKSKLRFQAGLPSNNETYGWFEVVKESVRTFKVILSHRKASGSGNIYTSKVRIVAIPLTKEQVKNSIVTQNKSVAAPVFQAKVDGTITLLAGGAGNNLEGVKLVSPGRYLALGAVHLSLGHSADQEALSTKLTVHQTTAPFSNPYTSASTTILERGSFPNKMFAHQYTPVSPSIDTYITKRADITNDFEYPLLFCGIVDLSDADTTIGLYSYPYSTGTVSEISTTNGHVALIPLDGYFNYEVGQGYDLVTKDTPTEKVLVEFIGKNSPPDSIDRQAFNLAWAAYTNTQYYGSSEIILEEDDASTSDINSAIIHEQKEPYDTNIFTTIGFSDNNVPIRLVGIEPDNSPNTKLQVSTPMILRLYGDRNPGANKIISQPYGINWNLAGTEKKTPIDKLTLSKIRKIANEGLPVNVVPTIRIIDQSFDDFRLAVSDSMIIHTGNLGEPLVNDTI